MATTWIGLVLMGLGFAFSLVSSTPATSDMKKPSEAPKPSLQPQTSDQAKKCQVQDYERLPCGEPGIKAAECNAINCCFDGQQCYYGKTVTVQCTLDGQIVLVAARDATLPKISLDSIHLLGGNTGPCSPVDSNSVFAVYQFPVTACGTTVMVQGGYVVYENRMLSSYEVGVGPRGSITRDTHFELYFQCRYSRVGLAALAIEPSAHANLLPVVVPGPLQVELRLGKGRCLSKGCEEEQIAYNSYYSAADYPVTKVLREPVYAEVRIVGRTDPNIVLVLGDCWATASPNPYSLPQWDLLVTGCPYKDDRYLTKLISVNALSGLAFPTHYRRFVLKMFTFVDTTSMAPLRETLYIHCSTAVCLPNEVESCEPACTRTNMKKPSEAPKPSLQPQTSDQAKKCQVQDYERLPCGEPGIKAAECNAINCCFDGQQCYYGKTVTVQCTLDGQIVLVAARDATLPKISLDSIHLLGGNTGPCSPVDSNSVFAVYQFPVTACGTTVMVQGGYVVYENRMLSSYEVGVGPRGSITRDTHFELYFQCRYSRVGLAALAIEPSAHANLLPVVVPGPLQVELRLGKGRCLSKGCEEEQIAYNSYYSAADYPVTKVLREPVYAEVRIVGRTDPNIVLVLGDCWATASPNPYSLPQWDLLVTGCPYKDDRYLTKLISVNALSGLAFPTHYRRFVLKMFTFVDTTSMAPLRETLYIHCSTAVCLPNEVESCEPACTRTSR
ncbi:Zona pellucida sperm-binding protein 4 [Bagarius yarrelli]|uniref:Zona pellucida sperm-binding protein 4 n=1 Tax=Bagarius yarrelli TaxID=175774 RepID=A0A556VBG9_BAGYA|nr:Zona pellucida sperm-binding protein 4 [Bagarius yarrelli]